MKHVRMLTQLPAVKAQATTSEKVSLAISILSFLSSIIPVIGNKDNGGSNNA